MIRRVFDFFEEASIQYHHRQQTVESEDGHGSRRKRSVIPWKASNADIPIPEDIIATARAERIGEEDDDDWASYNNTQAFYEVILLHSCNIMQWTLIIATLCG